MSETQNTQLIQDAYAAFGRGDIAGVLSRLSDDATWFYPGPKDLLPMAGMRKGQQQVAEFFTLLNELQEAEQFEPREFIAQGNKVVVLGHYRWRLKATGRTIESDWVHVFAVENGKVVSFTEYYDTHVAVMAYGAQKSAGA